VAEHHPTAFTFDGERMVPDMPSLAASRYEKGGRYMLAVWTPRSKASHDHYFAVIDDAWDHLLTGELGERFATSEHLRKWCLIRAGYCDKRDIVTGSPDEAVKLAAFVRTLDEYALVVVKDAVVTIWTAKSQSQTAMGRATFEQSKTDVINVLAGLLEVDPETLRKQGGMAA